VLLLVFLYFSQQLAMAPNAVTRVDLSKGFGDAIPFGDPSWYRAYNSPYYKETHMLFREKVRAFVDKEITPFCNQWDDAKRLPMELFEKAYQAGLLPGVVGPWPTEYAGAGPENYDYFHELILIDEICRCGSGGVVWGLVEGLQIGLPPILNFGTVLPLLQACVL
jgi:alkylation response protein AidB-like acyl-CoA dehydrogenase